MKLRLEVRQDSAIVFVSSSKTYTGSHLDSDFYPCLGDAWHQLMSDCVKLLPHCECAVKIKTAIKSLSGTICKVISHINRFYSATQEKEKKNLIAPLFAKY